MASDAIERRLAAVLCADAVGYGRLMARDPDATVRTIVLYQRQVGLLVTEHGGRVVDTAGDNVLAEFASATKAAECALELQGVLAARNAALAEDRRMVFRVGLHLGEVLVEDERIYGDGVNIAARLEAEAKPGGIVCSAAIHAQLRSHHGIAFDDLGALQLKNIPEPVTAYRLLPDTTSTGSRATTSGPASIAVLPFENLSGDAEQDYFADGITEDLITELSRTPDLLVTSRTSAFVYKGHRTRADQIGRELGVRNLLEGSVRRSGDRLRITAQLIDASSGMHVWAERYDRKLADIFALQDELSREIVSALRLRLGASGNGHTDPPTGDLNAYDLYLRAQTYLRRFDYEGVSRARDLLRQATDRDPMFGLAWGALGDSYTMAHAFWESDGVGLERGIALIERALELRPESPDLLVLLSRAVWFQGRFADSVSESRRALVHQPASLFAHDNITRGLRSLGRFAEAMESAEIALALDPHNESARMERGALHYFQGRFEEAVVDILWSIQRSPDFLPAYLIKAGCGVKLGRQEEAEGAVADILRLAPNYTVGHMNRQVPGADVGGVLSRDLLRAGLPARIATRSSTASGD